MALLPTLVLALVTVAWKVAVVPLVRLFFPAAVPILLDVNG